MSMTDPIADFLTRIRNAIQAKQKQVDIPTSKLKREISRLLVEQKYISGVNEIKDGKRDYIRIALKYSSDGESAIEGLVRVSSPGLRKYVKTERMPRVVNNLGIAIVST